MLEKKKKVTFEVFPKRNIGIKKLNKKKKTKKQRNLQ